MNIKDIFDVMIEKNASDAFIRENNLLKGRIYLEIETIKNYRFSAKDVDKIVSEILDNYGREALKKNKSYDITISCDTHWRFRIAMFYQRNTPSIVIRKIDLNVLDFEALNLPAKALERFCNERRGLILLSGSTGSGKSTTIASMLKYMNQNFTKHILTIEQPVEFVFEDEKSVLNQREIGKDVHSYADALRQFAIHSPDVIYIGNIKDQETCQAALTAAETGVLLFSTVHSIDAVSTVESLLNFFSPEQRSFIYNQLSSLLKGVVSLRLIPRIDAKGLIPAYEVMTLSPTISNLIRENKLWEIQKHIATGEIHGMKSLNNCLLELVETKKISIQSALEHSNNKEDLALLLRRKEME